MYIEVNLKDQKLTAVDANGDLVMDTFVSTARNGPGEIENSFCTPRGWHKIQAKIGKGEPVNSVFRGRRTTGEIYTPEMKQQFPERNDWILTRIMWLSGLEPGKNRHGNVDTMRRFIYIHGCPEDDPMGIEGSAGCIKMRNRDVIELFDQVEPGTLVYITEGKDK